MEEAKARNDCGPAVVSGLDLEKLNFKHIAGLGFMYVDRAVDLIEQIHLEIPHGLDCGVPQDLAVGRVNSIKGHCLSRMYPIERLETVIPFEMPLMLMNVIASGRE